MLTLPAHQLVYTVENVEYTKTTNQQLEHEKVNIQFKNHFKRYEGPMYTLSNLF